MDDVGYSMRCMNCYRRGGISGLFPLRGSPHLRRIGRTVEGVLQPRRSRGEHSDLPDRAVMIKASQHPRRRGVQAGGIDSHGPRKTLSRFLESDRFEAGIIARAARAYRL